MVDQGWDDAELVTIARLMLAAGNRLTEREANQAVDRLTDILDCMATTLAFELISGKTCFASFDNPETLARARSMAATIGATVENVKVDDDGSTHIIFAPPARERELYERKRAADANRATFRLIERPAADPAR